MQAENSTALANPALYDKDALAVFWHGVLEGAKRPVPNFLGCAMVIWHFDDGVRRFPAYAPTATDVFAAHQHPSLLKSFLAWAEGQPLTAGERITLQLTGFGYYSRENLAGFAAAALYNPTIRRHTRFTLQQLQGRTTLTVTENYGKTNSASRKGAVPPPDICHEICSSAPTVFEQQRALAALIRQRLADPTDSRLPPTLHSVPLKTAHL